MPKGAIELEFEPQSRKDREEIFFAVFEVFAVQLFHFG
jgi:hypothetical protein